MANINQAELFHAGTLTDGWRWFGAHPEKRKSEEGWCFRVWAPHAQNVCVVGDFNEWTNGVHRLTRTGDVWEGFIPGLKEYTSYKYAITGPDGEVRLKTDPYAFHCETRPATAGKLYDITGFPWTDDAFLSKQAKHQVYDSPLNIYEVHLGSWKKRPNGDFYDYKDMAKELAAYVKEMGYTAIELLPVLEHPFDGSWGYQCTGYFAPTSRYGTPKDFLWFVNHMHKNGIAVILDWVPAHFCKDAHGLYEFDGGCCYEYSDPNKWEHASWGTRVFDYGRPEVKSFLFSSARFWLEECHIDGLRVDAVASMLYLDYSRQGGAWTPNKYGGHENLEAIDFLRELNAMAFKTKPGAMMIAEESTAWPMVSRPADVGGLGFNLKWNMGWMNDMCHYLKLDPWFRQDHHKDITFSMMYAFSENFVLPISHDEVVHMKGSVVGKMPGDYTNQLRCTRGFYAYLLAHPGKKLLFMGAELGQWHEWNDEESLDWYLLENEENQKIHRFFKEANAFYKKEPALWEIDFSWEGFEWLVVDDNHNNVVVFLRKDKKGRDLLCAVNFSPNTYEGYRMGVPDHKQYVPVFNTDAVEYGGDGFGDTAPVPVEAIESHGKEYSAAIRIPAFGAVFLRGEGTFPKPKAAKTSKTPQAIKAVEKTAKAVGKTAKASAKTLVKAVKTSSKEEKAQKKDKKTTKKPKAK
ncbi:1,4-alpha-glucan branching protein GlgB [uncultured Oscillibacter sp.]|uniref:1,4-alpha-glucan branching protein GlgB n=1 Tax=uncultured Oscillibacter sp. TaxID=876091 RepID=UPI0025E2845F|nr:1,4-alpha-glucan branching protein GlgB [uncultured Oscillibacter sp.]